MAKRGQTPTTEASFVAFGHPRSPRPRTYLRFSVAPLLARVPLRPVRSIVRDWHRKGNCCLTLSPHTKATGQASGRRLLGAGMPDS